MSLLTIIIIPKLFILTWVATLPIQVCAYQKVRLSVMSVQPASLPEPTFTLKFEEREISFRNKKETQNTKLRKKKGRAEARFLFYPHTLCGGLLIYQLFRAILNRLKNVRLTHLLSFVKVGDSAREFDNSV